MCGFDGLEPTQGILELIQRRDLGSVILFSRNIASPSQVQKLTYNLQRAAKEAGHVRPLLIAVDQENGVVRRLGQSGTYLPGNMALGAINSSSAAYQVAKATGKELLSLGINWNLAPVMDVNNNALNPVIGVRSFGEDSKRVSQLCMAQVNGYHEQGVVTSLKHFPGHGDTATDSHLGLPVIDKSLEELEQVELAPYREILKKKEDENGYPSSIMVAHIALPKLVKKNQPASLASEIVNDLLREKLGYQGVVITDCVEMDAIKDTVGSARGALMALQAGNDISMISHTLAFQQEAFELLDQAVALGTIDSNSLQTSLDRVSQLKERFLSWEDALEMKDLEVIGCKEHVELSDGLYDRVPSLIRDRTKMIPIQKDNKKILFLAAHVPLTLAIDSEKEPFDSMYQALVQRQGNTKYVIFNEDTQQQQIISKVVLDEYDYIVVGTANANLYDFQAKFVNRLVEVVREKLIVVAVINPYDLMVFPEVDTYFVTYEYTAPAHEAFVRILFGEIEPNQNNVPVTILPNITTTKKTTMCNKKEYKVQEFQSNQMNDCYELWKRVYQTSWPLSINDFKLIVSNMKNEHHVIVSDDDKIVGFAVTQMVERTGQLALLMVDPAYQGKGIGTALNSACLEWFRKENGIEKIMVGSTYPRFFCGVPNHDEMGQRAQIFFKNRGFTVEEKVVWDMMGDLTDYKIPKKIEERMKKENIWIGKIKKEEEMKELYEFQNKYFDYWVSTYRHHAELGDYHDLIVAREGGTGGGKIIASLILYTKKGSHSNRTDLVWTDSSLFGTESGGMACVGVALEERKRGIGIGIVAFANKILCERGVKKSYVDWVELVDFYRRTGYQTWRDYKLAAMN
ncbi:glycoside hydrolase superfamily [Pilaira anomala]|nr:glycoside hydrolase superfamily [Pilaira anomala]